MKKLLLLFAAAIGGFATSAQTTIYTQDFSNGTPGWVIENLGTSAEQWRNVNLNPGFTTTGTNGALLAYGYNSAAGTTHNGNTQITSPSIDCSASASVFIKFEQLYSIIQQNSTCTVEASNDSIIWTEVYKNTAATDGVELAFADLSAVAANQANVYVRFKFVSTGDQYWVVDDMELFEPLSNDLEILAVNLYPYVEAPADAPLTLTVTNNGSSTIAAADISLDVAGNVETINTNLNLAPFQTKTVNLAHTLSVTAAGKVAFTVSSDYADDNSDNQSVEGAVYGLSKSTKKIVTYEEGTGTWCQFCPRGTVNMSRLAENYPETTALIAVHNDDPMMIDDYDAFIRTRISGFPSGLVDRFEDVVDPGNFMAVYPTFFQRIAPAEITVDADYDETSKEIAITVSSVFATTIEDNDFRIVVVITENNVTGTGSAWAQVNAYSGGARGPMGGYENKPNPVPASDMVYDDVARAALGSPTGAAGSLPTTVVDGEEYTYTESYTVPQGQKVEDMHVIAFIVDNKTGDILGSGKTTAASGTGIRQFGEANFVLGVRNNPFENDLNVNIMSPNAGEVAFTLIDATGRSVFAQTESVNVGDNGYTFSNLNLPAGVYTLTANMGENGIMVERVIAK